MNMKTLLAATAIALSTSAAAHAASITVNFPSGSSVIDASATQFFFTAGHFAEETFADTGVADLGMLDLSLNLTDNVLNSGASVDFNVLINSAVVGNFSIADGDGLGQFDYSFAVADADPIEDDYTLRFEVISTVPGGLGSVRFDIATSTATLTSVAPVPLPASVPLLLAGVGALGLVGRRKKAA